VGNTQLRVDLIPERVGSALHRELLKNGATAKKRLPKNLIAAAEGKKGRRLDDAESEMS
jgi:hypothetical protein